MLRGCRPQARSQRQRGYWWGPPQRVSLLLLGPQKGPRGEITSVLESCCGRGSHCFMFPLDVPGRREVVQSWV